MRIVGTHDGWVLERLEKELEGLNFPLTYFITYAKYQPTGGKTAALFTHFEHWNPEKFKKAAIEVDYPIALSANTAEDIFRFRNKTDIKVIHCGTDFKKDITFGVVGRTYDSGRKGQVLIEALNSEFNFLAYGKGWPCKKYSEEFDEMSLISFYRSIDYLVISSLQEGGPVPVLDALALGVPVIAPNVGWCWDYPVIQYDRGSVDSLRQVLTKLSKPRTWNDWRTEHEQYFKSLNLK